jgi:hypothetical protein
MSREQAGIAFAPLKVTRLSGNLPGNTHPPTRTGGLASRIAFYRYLRESTIAVKSLFPTVSLPDWTGW